MFFQLRYSLENYFLYLAYFFFKEMIHMHLPTLLISLNYQNASRVSYEHILEFMTS